MLGARIPLGGVSTRRERPGESALRRRGALLRTALAEMRDRGQCLSGLYTPHYSLYRRFGWQIAHRMISYAFPPKAVATSIPRPDGSLRRVTADDWQELSALRDELVGIRNGAMVRTERRWRAHVFSDNLKGQHDAVILVQRCRRTAWIRRLRTASPLDRRTLRRDDASRARLGRIGWGGILRPVRYYLMSHDLVQQIVLVVSEDEPLTAALAEPTHLKEPQSSWLGDPPCCASSMSRGR